MLPVVRPVGSVNSCGVQIRRSDVLAAPQDQGLGKFWFDRKTRIAIVNCGAHNKNDFTAPEKAIRTHYLALVAVPASVALVDLVDPALVLADLLLGPLPRRRATCTGYQKDWQVFSSPTASHVFVTECLNNCACVPVSLPALEPLPRRRALMYTIEIQA